MLKSFSLGGLFEDLPEVRWEPADVLWALLWSTVATGAGLALDTWFVPALPRMFELNTGLPFAMHWSTGPVAFFLKDLMRYSYVASACALFLVSGPLMMLGYKVTLDFWRETLHGPHIFVPFGRGVRFNATPWALLLSPLIASWLGAGYCLWWPAAKLWATWQARRRVSLSTVKSQMKERELDRRFGRKRQR